MADEHSDYCEWDGGDSLPKSKTKFAHIGAADGAEQLQASDPEHVRHANIEDMNEEIDDTEDESKCSEEMPDLDEEKDDMEQVMHVEATASTDVKKKGFESKRKPCPHCGKSFCSSYLSSHIRRAHRREKKYKCTLCTRSFFSRKEFESHDRIHLDGRGSLCDTCGGWFGKGAGLARHWNNASNDCTNPNK